MILFKKKPQDPLSEVGKEASEIMKITSVFSNGERIPEKYTCDGEDVSPPLKIEQAPGETTELALIMYDPDAPIGTFYHWLLYSIPPDIHELPENIPKDKVTEYGVQGVNDFGNIGYGGPCPPHGHGRHRYYFLIIALREKIGLEPGASINDLMKNIRGKIIGYGVLMGTYSR